MWNEKQKKEIDAEQAPAATSREAQLDAFWDISSLIPPQKKQIVHTPTTVTLTEITAPPPVQVDSSQEQTKLTGHAAVASQPGGETSDSSDTVLTRYIPPTGGAVVKETPKPDDEYTPEGSMLHRVRIYRWKTAYEYYEDFCKQAVALYDRHGESCAPVSFFSYVPQYSQMNRAQLNWYLYWRDGVRRGEILNTDYSYILLYIYEIINLADAMDVRVGQAQLCALRKAFRGSYPRLGHLLNEWICDYSLIHHLPPPPLTDLGTVSDCTLKEFYVPSTEPSLRYAVSLMAFASNYAYTKSKFATGENRPLYDKHMPGALCACLADGGEVGKRMAGAGLEESRLIRDAYVGALCSHRVKRRIEVDYCSFARSHELRILVTDIMKYTENKLRAYLGVKSRLGLYALPQSFRDCIDAYMKHALPQRARAIQAEPRREYDALYDVPKVALSLTNAARIEQSSWDTTERLIAAFEEPAEVADVVSAPIAPEPVMMPTESTTMPENETETQLFIRELGEVSMFINHALNCDVAAQRQFAKARGEMVDSLADRINELAAEMLGDVLLEECDGGYAVIEDYRSMFETERE